MPSEKRFPTMCAERVVAMRGKTYCISPVASRTMMDRDRVMRVMPVVQAAAPINA